jgi:cobalt/nickel transport protein
MAGTHMLIGIGESLISALVLLAIERTRPEMTGDAATGPRQSWPQLVRYGLLATFGLAIFVAPFACPWPDGLERVAAQLGFGDKTAQSMWPAVARHYQAPGIGWAAGATAVAGAAGSLIVFAGAIVLGRLLVPRATVKTPDPAPPS